MQLLINAQYLKYLKNNKKWMRKIKIEEISREQEMRGICLGDDWKVWKKKTKCEVSCQIKNFHVASSDILLFKSSHLFPSTCMFVTESFLLSLYWSYSSSSFLLHSAPILISGQTTFSLTFGHSLYLHINSLSFIPYQSNVNFIY